MQMMRPMLVEMRAKAVPERKLIIKVELVYLLKIFTPLIR